MCAWEAEIKSPKGIVKTKVCDMSGAGDFKSDAPQNILDILLTRSPRAPTPPKQKRSADFYFHLGSIAVSATGAAYPRKISASVRTASLPTSL